MNKTWKFSSHKSQTWVMCGDSVFALEISPLKVKGFETADFFLAWAHRMQRTKWTWVKTKCVVDWLLLLHTCRVLNGRWIRRACWLAQLEPSGHSLPYCNGRSLHGDCDGLDMQSHVSSRLFTIHRPSMSEKSREPAAPFGQNSRRNSSFVS